MSTENLGGLALLKVYIGLAPEQIFEAFAFADQQRFSVENEHLRRAQPRIVIGSHRVTVSPGILYRQDVAFPNLVQLSIGSKSICLAYITDHSIQFLRAVRIGDVDDIMPGVIHHRPDEVIAAGVHTDEGDRRRLFYYVHRGKEMPSLTNDEFARLKMHLELSPVPEAKLVKRAG